jgi:hypothetical protein
MNLCLSFQHLLSSFGDFRHTRPTRNAVWYSRLSSRMPHFFSWAYTKLHLLVHRKTTLRRYRTPCSVWTASLGTSQFLTERSCWRIYYAAASLLRSFTIYIPHHILLGWRGPQITNFSCSDSLRQSQKDTVCVCVCVCVCVHSCRRITARQKQLRSFVDEKVFKNKH